jgi:hypothetical protein
VYVHILNIPAEAGILQSEDKLAQCNTVEAIGVLPSEHLQDIK